MSRKMYRQQQQQCKSITTTWQLIIFFSCILFYPLCIHSTPLYATHTKQTPTSTNTNTQHNKKLHDRGHICEHDSIAELIKTSPVILKALGAHIFTDDDFNGMGLPLSHQWANELNTFGKQNEFLAKSLADETTTTTSSIGKSTSATSTSSDADGGGVADDVAAMQTHNNIKVDNNMKGNMATAMFAATSPDMESILITLTPETIYKGASLLKMSPGSENGVRSNSFVSSNVADSATLYDGQLNATLQPVHCFDGRLLELLPTELIVFGKLVTTQQKQLGKQMSVPQEPQMQLPHFRKQNNEVDILHISINGFHRWSSQFENHIWKHLGWDDWSDFTLCSVTCGKGVQQRFRRCLLDNPMVNLNMNANLNAIEVNPVGVDDNDDDDVTDVDGKGVDNDADVITVDNNKNKNDDFIVDDVDEVNDSNDVQDDVAIEQHHIENDMKITNEYEKQKISESVQNVQNIKGSNVSVDESIAITTDSTSASYVELKKKTKDKRRNFQTMKTNNVPNVNALNKVTIVAADTTKMPLSDELEHLQSVTLTSDNNEQMQVTNIMNSLNDDDVDIMRMENGMSENQKPPTKKAYRKLQKKHKATKTFSKTMFCEGYNIEQRNCNTFECSDDISDLLKFYKRPTIYEDVSSASPATSTISDSYTNVLSPSSSSSSSSLLNVAKTDIVTSASIALAADVEASLAIVTDDSNIASSAFDVANSTPSTTPANMGYIRSWHNPLNFTIMLTLRVKNDTKNSATIFSIRNSTHNLYLDQCQDGLRLYLERDKSTEMLPVKFNLYDYRWHQISISIQNGDFISIYVDCSWTNSFVVSKRLFTLPLDADVEIGRGFNGELQQLLLMPDNQERHQCSNRRTSINEVKRYIIDTFIGDYSN